MAELKALYRTCTVKAYQRQFSVLLCRCDDLSPMQQVNMFTAGLGDPLRTDVELLAPTNLQTAMSLACAYERKEENVAPLRDKPGHRTLSSLKGIGSLLGARPVAPNRPRFKRLTPEELAVKRANGECYHCNEKYSTDHKCTANVLAEDGRRHG
jgi:hypothetical protein